jgi:hypothetical protein
VGKEILVIINVRLHCDALDAVDGLLVVGMKRELDVCFTELDLFVAIGCA